MPRWQQSWLSSTRKQWLRPHNQRQAPTIFLMSLTWCWNTHLRKSGIPFSAKQMTNSVCCGRVRSLSWVCCIRSKIQSYREPLALASPKRTLNSSSRNTYRKSMIGCPTHKRRSRRKEPKWLESSGKPSNRVRLWRLKRGLQIWERWSEEPRRNQSRSILANHHLAFKAGTFKRC